MEEHELSKKIAELNEKLLAELNEKKIAELNEKLLAELIKGVKNDSNTRNI